MKRNKMCRECEGDMKPKEHICGLSMNREVGALSDRRGRGEWVAAQADTHGSIDAILS